MLNDGYSFYIDKVSISIIIHRKSFQGSGNVLLKYFYDMCLWYDGDRELNPHKSDFSRIITEITYIIVDYRNFNRVFGNTL